MRIGAVSDTHGTLVPSAVDRLAGVERILHAGDVGGPGVLTELETVSPVVAVRGNMDTGELEWRLGDTAVVRLEGYRIMVVHNAAELTAGGVPEGVDIVVSGHTHRAGVRRAGSVLFVNPGSAGGYNRDGRGPTAAIIDLGARPPEASIIDL